jgi:NAD(P)-dependent dehydrogenase (short-subunit alcohol dehydrogenase family)
MGKLHGKVAIITGAGSGLGRAMALLFGKEGAKVVVADRVAEGGEEMVNIIKKAGGEAIFIKTDVSNAADVRRMVQITVRAFGRLDILVNNAGITAKEGSTIDCTEEIFDEIIATNLKGVWLGMKYAIPEMLKTGGGSIINMASIAAFRIFATIPIYAASKGGVISLSRSAAVEFASRNLRINCIAPGPIGTPMSLGTWTKEVHDSFVKLTPRRQLGSPEEIAQVAMFLASDESSHVTAQTLTVDGGMEADVHVSLSC